MSDRRLPEVFDSPGRCRFKEHRDTFRILVLDHGGYLCPACLATGEPVYKGGPLTDAMREDMLKLKLLDEAEERRRKRQGAD